MGRPVVFRIKICGITRGEDALHAARAGADALGLNFYALSKRGITREQAALVANDLRTKFDRPPKLVGVFVNESADSIVEAQRVVGLDAVQLHGDEPPELIVDLPEGMPVIRAARIGEAGLKPVVEYLESCQRLGREVAAVLVDAAELKAARPEYGGSGRQVDWARVAAEKQLLGSTPLLLAGGLKAENVAEAIRMVGPMGVDTASGVESAPGVKDPGMVNGFVSQAREAFSGGS